MAGARWELGWLGEGAGQADSQVRRASCMTHSLASRYGAITYPLVASRVRSAAFTWANITFNMGRVYRYWADPEDSLAL